MPDVNFLRSLSTLGFDFLGLVTLEAWRFEWMAFGAAALPEILIDPCAIFSSSGRFESQWKKMDKGAFSGLGSVGYFFFFRLEPLISLDTQIMRRRLFAEGAGGR